MPSHDDDFFPIVKDTIRGKVIMNVFFEMYIAQSLNYVLKNVLQDHITQIFLFFLKIIQNGSCTADFVINDVIRSLVLEIVLHLNDIRVKKVMKSLNFILKHRFVFFVFLKHLYPDCLIQNLTFSLNHSYFGRDVLNHVNFLFFWQLEKIF